MEPTMTFTEGMKPLSCSVCFCIVRPGEQVTQYTERAGSHTRARGHHTDFAACQTALAREDVRYARSRTAAADGVRRYVNRDWE
jgi:ferredoxin